MPNKNKGPYALNIKSESEAELLIYGSIGDSWYDESVTAKEVVEQLQGLETEYLTVRINSYGGAVADGLAIFNAIRRHKSVTTARIDGVAVSAASLVAMACDTIEMAENGMMMIHAPWGNAAGNSAELREYADVLDTYAKAMASSYVRKSGKTNDEIMDILTDGVDHWYTADEAKEEGFADVIYEDELAAAASGFKESKYFANAPGSISAGATNPATPKAKTPKPSQTPKAAPVAATTKEEIIMPDKGTQASATEIKAASEALKLDGERRAAIKSSFAPHMEQAGIREIMDECVDNIEMTEGEANKKLLAHLANGVESMSSGVIIIEDAKDKFNAGANAAIMARAGLGESDGGNEFRGFSLLELARHSLQMNGINTTSMSKLELVAAAFTHTTSDFDNLLSNTANKSMQKGYEEAEETFQLWTNEGNLSDFKATSRVDLNMFPALEEVRDGAEYKAGTIGDRGETIQLATYGKLFSITRQTIINDDLDAFTKIPMRMGRAAIRTVGDLVYAVLTGNPNMADGTALFHSDHANLLTAGALSTASIDAMRVAMAKQTDGGSNARALNIRLSNIIVPIALEGAAQVVRDSEFEVGASAKNNTVPNTRRGTFEVIADARLDAASATNWYGAAGNGTNDTVEVAYLDGNKAPTLEQQNGWNVDGVEYKVRLDAGVKAIDHRTMAKNPNT